MKLLRLLLTASCRSYSNNVLYGNRQGTVAKLIPKETFAYFQEFLPHILDNVIKREYIRSSGIADYIIKLTKLNVAGSKHLQSSLTLHSYLTLAADDTKDQSLYQACVLAWVTEMVHGCFITSNDFEEASIRREKPCWHRWHDIMLIRGIIYDILNDIFKDKTAVHDVSQMINKAFFLTAIGQRLDNEASQIVDRNYSHFTMENYNKIIKYKTSYISLQLPILSGTYLANKTGVHIQQYVEDICMEIARLYQMQDDYFDCFHDLDVGKLNRDIPNSKCSWLAVTALQHCSQPQRIVFKTCYGSPEIAHIERIQQLYKKMQLPHLYKDEEKALYDKISQRVLTSKDILPPKLFLDCLN